MLKQNRPYSLQNVLDNMHGAVPRKICQTVLDRLVDEKVLQSKDYGKARIYLANQENIPVQSNEMLQSLDEESRDKKAEIEELQATLKSLTAELRQWTETPENNEALLELQDLKA
jgi:predicted transcriptional regulator